MQDLYFQGDEDQAGPFDTVQAFNDHVQTLAYPSGLRDQEQCDPYRELLPDDVAVYFSHADLHIGNIMIAGKGAAVAISGIVDWEQAGWYPELWEYIKLHVGNSERHGWSTSGLLEEVMQRYEDENFALVMYRNWRG